MKDTVKGFKDIEDASKRNLIKQVIEDTFKLYNFQPVETPIIEYEEFVRGDNPNDEAVSDTFKLQDRGKRKLALRYEFTFQLKRLAKNKKLPFKVYNIGPVFRDEPVTGNRWRQFTQCDADIIGADLNDVAEILKITSEILNKLKIKYTININNRKLLNEILDELDINNENKENVIREIDKLDKLPEKDAEDLTNLILKIITAYGFSDFFLISFVLKDKVNIPICHTLSNCPDDVTLPLLLEILKEASGLPEMIKITEYLFQDTDMVPVFLNKKVHSKLLTDLEKVKKDIQEKN